MDEESESRTMKLSGGGFDPCYDGQVTGDIDSMPIVGTFVTHGGDDRQRITPMLALLEEH